MLEYLFGLFKNVIRYADEFAQQYPDGFNAITNIVIAFIGVCGGVILMFFKDFRALFIWCAKVFFGIIFYPFQRAIDFFEHKRRLKREAIERELAQQRRIAEQKASEATIAKTIAAFPKNALALLSEFALKGRIIAFEPLDDLCYREGFIVLESRGWIKELGGGVFELDETVYMVIVRAANTSKSNGANDK